MTEGVITNFKFFYINNIYLWICGSLLRFIEISNFSGLRQIGCLRFRFGRMFAQVAEINLHHDSGIPSLNL